MEIKVVQIKLETLNFQPVTWLHQLKSIIEDDVTDATK